MAGQSLIAAIFGYIIGIGLAVVLSYFAGQVVVEFVTLLRLVDELWIFGLTLLMALLAALMPTRRLAHIDPAEVFRA